MRLVPNPWGGSWFDYLKAALIGLFLLVGLAIAIQRGAWVIAAVWLVLLAGALITWARDFKQAMKRKG